MRTHLSLLGTILIGCTAQGPDALELELEFEDRQAQMGIIVPDGEEWTDAPDVEVDEEVERDLERTPEPLDPGRVRPRLQFVWEWGGWAGADSCNFGVDFAGGPAVSLDGRYVIHDRRDEDWESDGGEGWEDYHEQEPLREGGLALVDREEGTTTWLGPLLLEGTELPHRNSGHVHCRQLRPLIEAGIERINASIPKTQWRPMMEARELGVDVGAQDSDPAIDLLFRNDRTLILRRKGVEVLHRETLEGLTKCNMPLELSEVLIDVETGYSLATVSERCVCFGSESDRVFAFELPELARERIAAFGPLGLEEE